MKKLFGALLLWFCAAPAGHLLAQVPDYTPVIEKYRKILQEEMAANHIAGLSIALTDGDRIVWAEGFGWYDSTRKYKVTAQTPFHIGSVCKTFTGLAIMMLQEEGKLHINDPLQKYLPGFQMRSLHGNTDNITLRSIMSHHAGIPDFLVDKFSLQPPDYKKVLEVVNGDFATQAPYTFFSYSNAGISLLGNVIENVSGLSYEAFVRRRILKPAGMRNAGFVKGTGDPLSVQLGYNLKGVEQQEMAVWDAPAGSIYASATDMAKFMQVHLSGGRAGKKRLFDSSTLVRMMQVENAGVWADFGAPQGLVWKLYLTEGGLGMQHDGGTLYHRAELSIIPEAGLGLVMLSNASSGVPLRHTDYDILNEAMRLKGKMRATPWPAPVRNIRHTAHAFTYNATTRMPQPSFVQADSAMLARFAGKYGTFGAMFHLTAEKNALKVQVMNQTFFLLPVAQDEFVPAGANNRMMVRPDMRMYFDSADDGRMVLIQCDAWGNQSIMGEKLPSVPTDSPWKLRTGNWAIGGREPFQIISDPEMSCVDDQLFLTVAFHIEMPGIDSDRVMVPLRIMNDSLAVTAGFSRFGGQAVQVIRNNDGTERLRFFGFDALRKNKE